MELITLMKILSSQKEEENIIKRLNKALQNKDVVILSDYGHGFVTDRI